jgi:hypothetical protein
MTSSYVSTIYKHDLPDGVPPPPVRRLRGYAFDPSLSLRLDTALVNQTVFDIEWEQLKPGPVGEYVEVVDYDPASGVWYDPIDLDAKEILAQDGLAPSESAPKFHQQMVYAVAMMTIGNFEYALGRKIFWAPHLEKDPHSGVREEYVPCLRIYPHALRAANAYYSPSKRALLFGYFRGPSGMVFSCLSHDIVAHETTHALLDGLHRRYVEDNHIDTLAFHEAFADLVALFQHFTFPEVLRHQIARTRGDLSSETPLGELAHQFGEATGRYGALRSAIGERENGVWHPHRPDPTRLATALEPHARGAILVAAVFGAFRAIYRERVRDLVRLATSGTGELPVGDIHPDLVERLSREATKTARHFLTMCIRALDYLPPVDPTYGDFLRAMVTADFDMVPNDPHRYRVALIESFRQWGIMPDDVRATSEEHLRWPFAKSEHADGWYAFEKIGKELRPRISESLYFENRSVAFDQFRTAQEKVHQLLTRSLRGPGEDKQRKEFERITGMNISSVASLPGLKGSSDRGTPTFEVHAVRPALRVSPDGAIMKQMIVTVTQRRKVPVDPQDRSLGEFNFRAGSTLIFDLDGPSLRYAVTRRIDDEDRLARVRMYRQSKARDASTLRSMYFSRGDGGSGEAEGLDEPFFMLHSDA